MSKLYWGVALAALVGVSQTATAEEGNETALRRLDQIVVLGSAGDVTTFAGSAAYLESDLLDVHADLDVNRVLRVVPGVHIQEEDGFGLRPNIGLRGTGLDRSDKITLMEDGVLIAPAPYAAPSAYYFPRVGRMSAVEIVKGPSSVKYGPRTQGGSINFVSSPIPDDLATSAKVQIGEFGTLNLQGRTGGSVEAGGLRWGGLLEATKDSSDGFKKLDNGGGTGFDIEDYVAKVSVGSVDGAAMPWIFELKGQYSDELSDETYLGLTRTDFEVAPTRRYAASAADQMSAEHSEISGRFAIELGKFDFAAIAYRTEFKRDWFKLDKVGSVSIADLLESPSSHATEIAVLQGADSLSGALSIKHNNRDYETKGIQFSLARELALGGATHELELGVRLHEDSMDRFQWVENWTQTNGDIAFFSRKTPGTDSNRIDSAEALAVYIKDDISIGKLTLSPGVRFEDISLKREDWGKADPLRTTTAAVNENDVQVVIPGFAASYAVTDTMILFGGVHKGFSPPAPGSTNDDAEEAINYEVGARLASGKINAEAVAFFNDYSNLLGACTASSGGNCDIGQQFNGGEVDVSGLEVSASSDLSDFGLTLGDLNFPVSLAYTYTNAEFQTDFNSDFESWGSVQAGDQVPYIPENQVNFGLGIAGSIWGIDANVNWVDESRAVAGTGFIALDERIDARTIVDLSGHVDLNDAIRYSVRVKNLTDETYVAALRPSGLRGGLPRQILASIEVRF